VLLAQSVEGDRLSRHLPLARLTQALLSIALLHCVFAAAGADDRIRPASYSGEAIEGVVVAPITNAPLKGVVVVANWYLDGVGVEHPKGQVFRRSLHIAETVTDSDGHFSFSAWGPRDVPSPAKDFYRMDLQQPWLYFFRGGYYFNSLSNGSPGALRTEPRELGPPIRSSEWNGRKMYLHRYPGSEPEYIEHLQSHGVGLFAGCNWNKVPRLAAEFIAEGERLRNVRGSNVILKLDDLAETYGGVVCGSPRKILHEYLVQVPRPGPAGRSSESK